MSQANEARRDRMPVVFLPHGGGPWPFVDVPFGKKDELAALATYLRSLPNVPKNAPKALLAVSAHWEEEIPTVMSGARPPMLYDYYGFPPESYQLTWSAPGDPALASEVAELLEKDGFATARDGARECRSPTPGRALPRRSTRRRTGRSTRSG